MAIESAILRRSARTVCLVLLVALWLCATAAAQGSSVMSGSVVGMTHDTWGQIYKIAVSSKGDVLFLDTSNGAMYRLLRDGKTFTTLSPPDAALTGNGKFYNSGMAFDSHDTLYITSRYSDVKPGIHFYRVPYDATNDTWPLDTQHGWPLFTALDTYDVAVDANDNLVVSTETGYAIYRLRVNQSTGAQDVAPEPIITGLKYRATKIAVDHAGNVYFSEDPWTARSAIVPGVFRIPAGTTITGTGIGDAEAQCTRIDPNLSDWRGLAVDAAGNVYISDQADKFAAGKVSTGPNDPTGALVMVPNVGGTLDTLHPVVVAPIPASGAVAIDPRGILWIPTGTSGWQPNGSKTVRGTENFVKYMLGTAELGASAVGTAGGAGTVWFTFSRDTTLGTPDPITVSQLGSGSDFVPVLSDPNADPNASMPAAPCTAGATYHAFDRCPVWGKVNPRYVGNVSGDLKLLDAQNNVLSGSTTHFHGIGQGAAMSVLVASKPVSVATALTTPKQVAADSVGNSYVADAGAAKVLKYPGGTAIGTGLTAPTGVAVDGAGNLYIADSGNVIKVPLQGTQTVLQTGLGSSLNLALDHGGNLYVADPANARVVKVLNGSAVSPGTIVSVGSFSHPSAVAVDAAGDLLVADGANLIRVTSDKLQTTVTNQLGAVTGLAVDPSGSVYVAQSTGVLRIPVNQAGALDFNASALLGGTAISAPVGVALDSTGNLYVSETSTVTKLSVNGVVNVDDFGPIVPYVESDGQAQIFNIGNQPLTLSPWANDPLSGTDADDFKIVAASDTPACDPAVPTVPGTFCWLGVGLTASAEGTRSGAVTINAANATPVTLDLSGTAVIDTRPGTTTTVTTSPAQPTYPANLTVTVTVAPVSGSGTPDGTVTVSVTGQTKTSAQLQNGVATFTYSRLNGGLYKIQATYSGSGTIYGVSAGSAQVTVNRLASTVKVAAPPAFYLKIGDSIQLTANVTAPVGSPTGKVVFLEGAQAADPGQPFSNLDANGNATFNTSELAVGQHTLTAVYQGDTNFASSSAAPITFRIVNPTVKVTANPASLSLTAGTPGSSTLTLTSIVGYEGSIRLACTNLPKYSECTFTNPQPEVKSNQSVPIVVTVSTNVPVNVAAQTPASPWLFASMFGFGAVGLLFGKKTRYNGRMLTMICMLLLVTSVVAGMAACGNSGYSKTPPAPKVVTQAGTYNVTITTTQVRDSKDVTLYEPETSAFTMQVKVQ